eukprot:6212317-Pleurochrysis_carterae.AAC.4
MRRPGAAAPFRLPSTSTPASAPSLPASSWPTLTDTGSPPATSKRLTCSSSDLSSVTVDHGTGRGWLVEFWPPRCGSAARLTCLTARVSSPCACCALPEKKSLAAVHAAPTIVHAIASVRSAAAWPRTLSRFVVR